VLNQKVIIALLVALNVGLAGLLVLRVWNRAVQPSPAVQPAGPHPSMADAGDSAPVVQPGAAGSAPAPRPTPAWTWQSLDSTDLRQLIANLRAVECPEQTVRDIVLGRINRQFAAREATLQLRPEHVSPWEAARWTDSVRWTKQRQLRELDREKRALIKELLGVELPPDQTAWDPSGDTPGSEAAYAALSEVKREPVRQIQQRFRDQWDELEHRTRGFWEPEDLAEYHRLRAQYHQALAGVLTQTELEDFLIGTSAVARQLWTELAAFAPTEQEFRSIFRLRQQFPELFDLPPGYEPGADPEAAAQMAQLQQQYEQQLKTALGESRYADYQRAHDLQYQALARIGQQAGLSPQVTVQAYQAQQAALAQMQQLRTDPSLDPAQRRQALRAVRDQLNKTMLQLLGQPGFQAWQQAGGALLYLEPRPATPQTSP
jgi:hypothetical protein